MLLWFSSTFLSHKINREEGMMFSTPAVRMLEESHISPLPVADSDPRPPLPLTFFDMLWLNYSPVERLFFYNFPHPTSHFLDSHLPKLKSALSLALASFYPLAGTIRRRPEGRYEISTTSEDSVPLTVSEYVGDSADDFFDFSGDQPRPVKKLLTLVPSLPKSRDAQPLLAVQITLFPTQGLCLALAIHHSACDGFSSMQFVKLWAAAVRAEGSVLQLPLPVIDRSVIADPRCLYEQSEKTVLDAVAGKKMVFLGTADSAFCATFSLSASNIRQFKERVQARAEELGKKASVARCSSFMVSSAYAWICLLKTRCITDDDGSAHFTFAVDWRRRIRPPIPANYYGNCLSGCFVKCKAEELLGKDGMLIACAAIGKGIEDLGDDVNEVMDRVEERLGEVAPWRPLSMAGSPKLGVYEVDFGWEKARKVEVVSTRNTGAMAIAESRVGDGGIEFSFILPEEELSAFARHFHAGLHG